MNLIHAPFFGDTYNLQDENARPGVMNIDPLSFMGEFQTDL